ncbi:MAG: hypothetical protein HFI67_12210 [Lachnospiraceae bacterium]|jgi:hypothetical protein|nr:hypothetical protein [Lachnospiraceae bacterium]
MTNWNITSIENITHEEAEKNALETMKIKDHDCFFVDFGGAFGYSVLVFRNGKHIHYANDYELHHGYLVEEQRKEALRQYYIDTMNNILFTDAELLQGINSYDEYKRKYHFLRNYWIMQFDRLSIFGIGDKAQREFDETKPNFPFYNPVSLCYVADVEIVEKSKIFLEHLENAYAELKTDDEAFRDMVSHELANHEACITCDYRDALGALGMVFEELTEARQHIVINELNRQIQEYC